MNMSLKIRLIQMTLLPASKHQIGNNIDKNIRFSNLYKFGVWVLGEVQSFEEFFVELLFKLC